MGTPITSFTLDDSALLVFFDEISSNVIQLSVNNGTSIFGESLEGYIDSSSILNVPSTQNSESTSNPTEYINPIPVVSDTITIDVPEHAPLLRFLNTEAITLAVAPRPLTGAVESLNVADMIGMADVPSLNLRPTTQYSRATKIKNSKLSKIKINSIIKDNLNNPAVKSQNVIKTFATLWKDVWDDFKEWWHSDAAKDIVSAIFKYASNKSPVDKFAKNGASNAKDVITNQSITSETVRIDEQLKEALSVEESNLQETLQSAFAAYQSGTDVSNSEVSYSNYMSDNNIEAIKFASIAVLPKDLIDLSSLDIPGKTNQNISSIQTTLSSINTSSILTNGVNKGNTSLTSIPNIANVPQQDTGSRNNKSIEMMIKAGPDLLSNMYDIAFVRDNAIISLFSMNSYKEYKASTRAASENILQEDYFIPVRTTGISIPMRSQTTTQINFLETQIEAGSSKVTLSPEGNLQIDADFNLYVYKVLQHLAGHSLRGQLKNSKDNGYRIQAANVWTTNTFDIVVPAITLSGYQNSAFSKYLIGGKNANALFIFKDVKIIGGDQGVSLTRSDSGKITLSFDFIFKNLQTYFKEDNATESVLDNVQTGSLSQPGVFSNSSIEDNE